MTVATDSSPKPRKQPKTTPTKMARRSVSFGTKKSISVSAAPPTLYLQTAPNLSSRRLSRQQTQGLSEREKHANKH